MSGWLPNLGLAGSPASAAVLSQAASALYYTLDPFHAEAFSAAFRAEARRSDPDIATVLELHLPDGSTLRASTAAVEAAVGLYQPLVESMARVRREVTERSDRLATPTLEVTLIDTPEAGRTFTKLLAGKNRHRVRGSRAVVRWASPRVPEPDWYTLADYQLERWEQQGMRWRLTLQPDDKWLEREFPKFSITTSVWPDAHADAIGEYVPLIYGVHDSLGVDTTEAPAGMVPGLYVDTVGFRYAFAVGQLLEVDPVYKDGVEVDPAAIPYTVTYPVVGGIQWTLVDFDSDQGEATITADVQGYDERGDRTGPLIVNPARELEHLLTHFVIGDYRRGLWTPPSTRLDPKWFGETARFLDALGHRGSMRFAGEQRTGLDAVNEWCASEGVKPFWTRLGKLAVRALDHRAPGDAPYVDYPWFRGVVDEAGESFSPESDPENVTTRVSVSYVRDSAADKFRRTIDVADLSVEDSDEDKRIDSLERPWSEAKV